MSMYRAIISFLINGKSEDEYKTPKGRVYHAIKLVHSYAFKWKDYKLRGLNGIVYDDYEDKQNCICPGFSYLIVEVIPQKQSTI